MSPTPKNEEAYWEEWVRHFDVLLWTVTTAFAASFRHQRKKVFEKTQESFQNLMNTRDNIFFQWRIFVSVFIGLDILFIRSFFINWGFSGFAVSTLFIYLLALISKIYLY